jgi:hypothetical protein
MSTPGNATPKGARPSGLAKVETDPFNYTQGFLHVIAPAPRRGPAKTSPP